MIKEIDSIAYQNLIKETEDATESEYAQVIKKYNREYSIVIGE